MTGGNLMETSSCAGSELDLRKTVYQPTGFTKTVVKVRFGESVFTVDRSLLEQHCEYFRALFQSGMKECMEDEICLQAPSACGFLVALRVMHGERPMLSADEIVDAIQCAVFLQIELLTEHLINVINSDNCLLMYHTAATFGLLKLFKSAALFIQDMYADLKEDVKCLQEDLIEYIESLIPNSYVLVGSHSPSIKLLQDFMRTVCYLDEDEKDWKVLTHLPLNASTTMAGVTVLDNKIYIVGGVYDISNKVVDSGFCYDVSTDTWSTFSNPQQLRYNCTLVPYENSKGALFTAVVRGDSVFTVNRRATVEYAIEDIKWRTKTQMTGFPRIGSMWTFLLRLPKQSRELLQKKDNGVEISSDLSSSASVHCVD
ncbi:kelch repeat and BTB domain-containing protein 13 [Garra rufa]|uniref:kelch repeat and BTB domain-containing protein 13 n=1 Tax=Garra rufa TaxID=137080 RepID=UPI003CCEE684